MTVTGSTGVQTFPLRLSAPTIEKVSDLAHSEGMSLNYFISLAVEEKIFRAEQVGVGASHP